MQPISRESSHSRPALALLSLQFSTTLKQLFNGGSLVVSYLRNGRTTKETAMSLTVIASRSAFAINHYEWISYSHWGMFPVRLKSSNSREA
jgi:hypothetical protein